MRRVFLESLQDVFDELERLEAEHAQVPIGPGADLPILRMIAEALDELSE